MSDGYTGWIVRAAAGRERGGIFCVVGADRDGRLLLADGRHRKLARPKAKAAGHVELLTGGFNHPAIQTLRQGKALTDKGLIRALAAFRDEMEA